MPKFNKTNRTAEELLAVLKIKGLSIADDAKAVNYIHNIGYYRLKAYFYPLYKDPKYEHLFKVDATFDKVMNMYRLPLGNLCHIFMNLKSQKAKKRVAKYFGLQEPVFSSWMLVLGNLRNMCCHHSRTWNRELAVNTADPHKTIYPWIDVRKTNPKRIYYRISMIRYLLFTISPDNNFKDKLQNLIEKYPTVDIAAVGFPIDWIEEPLWTLKK